MTPKTLHQIPTPDGGAVVLLDWMDVPDGCNLVRVDEVGEILWKAVPPRNPGDCFTQVRRDGDVLKAYTYSGYLVSIGVDDGTVTVLQFTK
ncbi:hypothetical protein EB235_16935 [Mesorhizobium loti R88b]|uniref:Uncharacterized protein n=1 Tax=Mesorhizobium loti R88b TaxID=935548 RepID=A0A6M7WVF2_RHILI|nr:hypothetical protein EB235_16935 [Mesorhizobium loti R88b]